MPTVSTGSSTLKSPLRYDRRVKRGIGLPNDSTNPRKLLTILHKTPALPASKTDSMLFDLVHKWSLTCIAHVLDLLKINWIEFPHIAMTAAHDTPQRSPTVSTLSDSHNKLASPFIFHRHVYSSSHSSSRLDPPLLASWYHTLVIQSQPSSWSLSSPSHISLIDEEQKNYSRHVS